MADLTNNVAIWYASDSFDASGKKLPVVGRTAANEGFLKALATHGGVERLYCFAGAATAYEDFQTQIKRLCQKYTKTSLIQWEEFHELNEVGCLYIPDPALEVHAWNRRSLDSQRSYSICGVTHTTAHHETIDAIGAFLTAPMQSWDALICTSRVVRATVGRLLDDRTEYLQERGAGRIKSHLQLPVIPLGIESQQFNPSGETARYRKELRQQIGASDDDVVFLYLGRMSVNIKANPYSMLNCLEKAAKRTNKKIYLVMAGWFQDSLNANAFAEAIKVLSPSINTILMDGRQNRIRSFIWFAADIFLSLVDNVQETFGISPLEAMAAGLPVVVTDWDGYRDTVVDGVTGFRIPTIFPRSGAGEEIAIRFGSGIDAYDSYLGHCSAATIIDESSCVDAMLRLVEDINLRRQMGESGRKHVRDNFDWKIIIRKYQELWRELAERRSVDDESVPLREGLPANPLRQDPFRLFSEYPTHVIDDKTGFVSGESINNLDRLYSSSLFAAAIPLLLPKETCRKILTLLNKGGVLHISDIDESMLNIGSKRLCHTVAWLAKVGLIKMVV